MKSSRHRPSKQKTLGRIRTEALYDRIEVISGVARRLCILIVIVLASNTLNLGQAPDEIVITPHHASTSASRWRSTKIPRQIVDDVLADYKGKERSEQTRGLSAFALDLNSDGKPEILVQGFCGAHRCQQFLYRALGNRYESLFAEDDVEGDGLLDVQKVSTNGYRNLVAEAFEGVFHAYIYLYKFNGKKYQLRECYERNYSERRYPKYFKTKRVNCSTP